MTNRPLFSCQGVGCIKGGRLLFSELGFCLGQGGFLLLKGANGSGKTSLMKILTGLQKPAGGEVLWNGSSIYNNAEYRQGLTYIGHRNAIKPELTVRENIGFWARLFDTPEMIAPAMDYFGLTPLQDMPSARLSAGWTRRLALSRLLLSRADIWLLDEPTNFLDAEAVELTGQLIETRVNHGGIVIVASHSMSSAFSAHLLQLEDFAPPHRTTEIAEAA